LDQNRRLIIGLGNPGIDYVNTRHNAGFMVVDYMSKKFSLSLNEKKKNICYGFGSIGGIASILAKPLAYMNRSGPPCFRLAENLKISCKDLLVIHDDIDLSFGRLKIKEKGGDGGHNGLRSLIDAFGCNSFTRLRIGIGRLEDNMNVAEYVLNDFSSWESRVLKKLIIINAKDAVYTIICKGAQEAMNRFNGKHVDLNVKY